MAVPDKVYKNRANAWKSEPKVIGAVAKKLRAGTDYEKDYAYSYKEDTVLSDGVTIRYAGEPVRDGDIPAAGTTIIVTVTGKGNYTGILSEEYRIVGYDISKARVSVPAQIYTGEEITPGMDVITVKHGGKELGKESYRIVGYSNNIDKGRAEMIIKGIGEYGGTKTVRFRIRSNSFFWWLGF